MVLNTVQLCAIYDQANGLCTVCTCIYVRTYVGTYIHTYKHRSLGLHLPTNHGEVHHAPFMQIIVNRLISVSHVQVRVFQVNLQQKCDVV